MQKVLKKDGIFKTFIIKFIQKMIKDEINTIVSNPKFSMANFKISPKTIKRFFMLTINNKYVKNTPIL